LENLSKMKHRSEVGLKNKFLYSEDDLRFVKLMEFFPMIVQNELGR